MDDLGVPLFLETPICNFSAGKEKTKFGSKLLVMDMVYYRAVSSDEQMNNGWPLSLMTSKGSQQGGGGSHQPSNQTSFVETSFDQIAKIWKKTLEVQLK